jgi:hypothetical protein
MAHEGGGNFYFIEQAAQIPDLLTSELGEALEVVVRGAAITVVLPPGADAEPLKRFRHTRAVGDNELRVELGDLVAGQEVSAVIAVELPRGVIGEETSLQVSLTGAGIEPALEGEVRWTYASHVDNDRQERDGEVDRAVAELYAARARAEATEANRAGDLGHARRILERTAKRIRSYAGSDQTLARLATSLERDVGHFAEESLSPMALKSAMFAAHIVTLHRDPMGRAMRRGPEA